MDLNTTRNIVRDELKQFFSQRCRLNQTNSIRDIRVLIYAFLFVIVLLAIILTWWLNWLPEKYWWGKIIMTFAFIILLFWLKFNYDAIY
jgi:hypothetical protein